MAMQYLNAAVRDGLREEMLLDPDVIVLGEDVALGVYGFTSGLQEEFGCDRVRNTPIAETTTVGVTLGAAACGLRPVTDLMMANFTYTGMDQIANQLAKLRYMTGGQIDVPAVLIAVEGIGGYIAAQHSETVHPFMMCLGGLKVVCPTTPYDAKGLIKSAIRDDNPVIFLVPQMLFGTKGEVPDEEYLVPMGVASVRQEGSDVTIVAIGNMMREALSAAEQLGKDGVSAEIVDPRTLNPLDEGTILESVAKTGRLVVVDEARELCSAASEIVSMAVEECFGDLKAPPRRVTAPNVPVPFSPPLEDFIIPKADQIVNAVRDITDR
jgi:pyruvate dehydrogenase E1 component beta subunit